MKPYHFELVVPVPVVTSHCWLSLITVVLQKYLQVSWLISPTLLLVCHPLIRIHTHTHSHTHHGSEKIKQAFNAFPWFSGHSLKNQGELGLYTEQTVRPSVNVVADRETICSPLRVRWGEKQLLSGDVLGRSLEAPSLGNGCGALLWQAGEKVNLWCCWVLPLIQSISSVFLHLSSCLSGWWTSQSRGGSGNI